jgi:NAD(P)-dependent dehydrogenase (short-subunit alcohol dehydrogenase family)
VGYATANLRSQQDIREAVAEAAKFFGGRVDVLVNNAGTTVRLG